MRELRRKPARDTLDGLLDLLTATTLLLGLLLLWARTYEQSCLALASPGLVYIAAFWGMLQYRLERRRFAIDYYLAGGSPWRRLFRGAWLPTATSMIAALPLAVFLAVFAALAHGTDWLFLAGASVLAPLLFNGLSVWPGRHFRGAAGGAIVAAPAVILTSRLAGRLLLALVVVAYIYFNYSMIAGSTDIFPGSLELTAMMSMAQVSSACPVVETGLRAAAGFDGATWWIMTGAPTEQWTPDGMRPDVIMMVVWAAFFLNAALAMTGFIRAIEGAMLVAARAAPRTRSGGARGSRAATTPSWRRVGIRASILLLVPLSVLAVTGYNVLQQRAAERWSAEIRTGDFPQIRRAIDERVDFAFGPAYAAIPQLVDRHVSVFGIFDQATPFFGKDNRLISELRRTVNGAREAAAAEFYREMHEEGLAQLAHVFQRDLEALPPWLRSAYEWVLQPVWIQAERRWRAALEEEDPGDILNSIERVGEARDFARQLSDFSLWFTSSIVSSDPYKELLRSDVTAVVDWEKDRTKEQLSRALDTAMFTPLGDFVPSRLRPASQ